MFENPKKTVEECSESKGCFFLHIFKFFHFIFYIKLIDLYTMVYLQIFKLNNRIRSHDTTYSLSLSLSSYLLFHSCVCVVCFTILPSYILSDWKSMMMMMMMMLTQPPPHHHCCQFPVCVCVCVIQVSFLPEQKKNIKHPLSLSPFFSYDEIDILIYGK